MKCTNNCLRKAISLHCLDLENKFSFIIGEMKIKGLVYITSTQETPLDSLTWEILTIS